MSRLLYRLLRGISLQGHAFDRAHRWEYDLGLLSRAQSNALTHYSAGLFEIVGTPTWSRDFPGDFRHDEVLPSGEAIEPEAALSIGDRVTLELLSSSIRPD